MMIMQSQSAFNLTNTDMNHIKQNSLLQSIGEVIDKFQLDNLNHNFYHQDAFFQQGESLVITMTTYDKDTIKQILSKLSQVIK